MWNVIKGVRFIAADKRGGESLQCEISRCLTVVSLVFACLEIPLDLDQMPLPMDAVQYATCYCNFLSKWVGKRDRIL
jgi:hypothetical protein